MSTGNEKHVIYELTDAERLAHELETRIIYEPLLELPPVQPSKKLQLHQSTTSKKLWRLRSDLATIAQQHQQQVHSNEAVDPQNIKVLKDLCHMKGWFLASGAKYGVPWVAYADHPSKVHSTFMIVPPSMMWIGKNLVALGRVASSTRKVLLLPLVHPGLSNYTASHDQAEAKSNLQSNMTEVAPQSSSPRSIEHTPSETSLKLESELDSSERTDYISLRRVNLAQCVLAWKASAQHITKLVHRDTGLDPSGRSAGPISDLDMF